MMIKTKPSRWLLSLLFATRLLAQDTGIFVGGPQIFDDRSLQLMLNAARAQLAALRPIDQTSLLGHLGNIQGANLTQSQFSLQVNGLPSVGNVTTTASGGPSPVVTSDNSLTTGGSNPGTTVENKTITTTPSSTLQRVATQPSVAANAPTLSTPSTTLPTTYGTSALNTLNEQMQLTYEIANLELLLEGPLSDRFIGQSRELKQHATIGFPISISAPADYDIQDAVAEVEVTVKQAQNPSQSPSLLTILPREKTYNVASITDRSVSLGGGIVTSVASVGVSWLWGHKTYYLVQAQDTLALQLSPSANELAFAWQFRPVLGQKTVQSGMKQTFAQVAFAIPAVAALRGCLGFAQTQTRWREYDAKTGVVGDIIVESPLSPPSPLYYYDLTPSANNVGMEDSGSGNVTVTLGGDFLPGTRVRLGASYLDETTSGFLLTPRRIQFTAPAVLLAASTPMLLGRDGMEHPILSDDAANQDTLPNPPNCDPPPPPEASAKLDATKPSAAALSATTGQNQIAAGVHINNIVVSPYTDTQSLVTLSLENYPVDTGGKFPLIVTIGGKVFGLRDAPFKRTSLVNPSNYEIQLFAPNDLLRNSRSLAVKRLFWGPQFSDEKPLPLSEDYALVKVTLVRADEADSLFAISGARAKGTHVLVPALDNSVPDKSKLNSGKDTTTKFFTVDKKTLATIKQFVFQVDDDPPVMLAVPTADDAERTDKPSLDKLPAIAPSQTGAPVTLTGNLLEKVKQINYFQTLIPFVLAVNKKSITFALPPEITASEGIRFLDVMFTDGTTSRYEVDVTTTK